MKETDFQQSLSRGLQSQGAYVYKVPDLARAVTKPFDLCASINGRFTPIECKLSKYVRKDPIRGTDPIVRLALFAGRAHQIPRLLQIWGKGQGDPQIAVCLAILDPETKVVTEKRAWMFPAIWVSSQDTWRVDEMEDRNVELKWVPGVGWIAEWV